MNRLMVIALCAVLLTSRADAQERGHSSAEAAAFRSQWTIDNWDKGGPLMRYVFLNMTEFWNHSLIVRGGPVRPLEEAPRAEVAQFITTTKAGTKPLQDYVRESTVNGVVVMHRGTVAAERYGEGFTAETPLVGWSMSKTVTGVLVGMLVADGRLRLDDPAPVEIWQRAGDPRGEITLRHLLQMRSGLRHEEQADPVYESAEVRMMFLDGAADMAGWAEAQPRNRWLGCFAATPN